MITTTSPATRELPLGLPPNLAAFERRNGGVVYTPRHVTAFVLEQAGYPKEQPASLLDPAAGGGVFLEVALERLAGRWIAAGEGLDRPAGRDGFLRTVEATLFAIDIDPMAVEETRRAVRATVSRLCRGEVPPGFFASNVLCADFLTADAVARMPPAVAGGFDFIVGNPPYVSAARIAMAYKQRLRKAYVTARGRLDLYTVFIERAVQLLAPMGRLAFITPDKFLASQTSAPLRSLLLSRGAIRTVARFRSHKLFPDVATVPCVTVYERSATQSHVTLLECADRVGDSGAVEVERSSRLKPTELSARGEWSLTEPVLKRLVGEIVGGHPSLSTLVSRLSAGVATGRDAVYVLPAAACDDLEPELLKPAVRGRDLQPFAITDPGLRIIVPYRLSRGGSPEVLDLEDFPATRSHLAAHRAALEARHCVRVWQKRWYELHDPVSAELARAPKILVPDVACNNRFVVDTVGYWPLHSVYYLVPKTGVDPGVLTAILNSTPIEFLIRLRAPIVKDGFSRYRKQFLGSLPIPWLSTQRTAAVRAALESGDRGRLDELVVAAFGLSESDHSAARRYLESRSA